MRRAPGSPRDDRPVRWPLYLNLFAVCGSLLLGLLALSRSPERVEQLFVEGFGTTASGGIARLSGAVPFSLAEVVLVGLGVALLGSLLLSLRAVRKRERSLRNVLLHGGVRLAAAAMMALTLFYALWGLNYAREPAHKRLGWEAKRLEGPEGVEELVSLAEQLVDLTNRHYLMIHGAEDAGAPTEALQPSLDASLDAGFLRVTASLGLHPGFGTPRGPAKPLLLSPVSSWLGISGFYFPFTGEANYNTQPPAWQRPLTIAHEKAHQRGIASEDEANFFGFLACIHSDDPVAAYAGWLFAQRRMLTTLLRTDRELGRQLIARRLPGVQRDVDASHAFWSQWDGYGHTLGSTVNDAYLKTNRVEGGVKSYGRAVRLLIAYARQQDGRFEVPNG